MNKLKQNNGYTLSIVLVIVIVLTILTSSILFSIIIKIKTTNNTIQKSIEEIELEKITYSYLNSLVINNKKPSNLDTTTYKVVVNEVSEDTFIIIVSLEERNTILETEIKFTTCYTSYTILRWGVK